MVIFSDVVFVLFSFLLSNNVAVGAKGARVISVELLPPAGETLRKPRPRLLHLISFPVLAQAQWCYQGPRKRFHFPREQQTVRNDVKDEEMVNLVGEEKDEEKGEEEMEEAGEKAERTSREIKGRSKGSDSFISKESVAAQRTSPGASARWALPVPLRHTAVDTWLLRKRP